MGGDKAAKEQQNQALVVKDLVPPVRQYAGDRAAALALAVLQEVLLVGLQSLGEVEGGHVVLLHLQMHAAQIVVVQDRQALSGHKLLMHQPATRRALQGAGRCRAQGIARHRALQGSSVSTIWRVGGACACTHLWKWRDTSWKKWACHRTAVVDSSLGECVGQRSPDQRAYICLWAAVEQLHGLAIVLADVLKARLEEEC